MCHIYDVSTPKSVTWLVLCIIVCVCCCWNCSPAILVHCCYSPPVAEQSILMSFSVCLNTSTNNISELRCIFSCMLPVDMSWSCCGCIVICYVVFVCDVMFCHNLSCGKGSAVGLSLNWLTRGQNQTRAESDVYSCLVATAAVTISDGHFYTQHPVRAPGPNAPWKTL